MYVCMYLCIYLEYSTTCSVVLLVSWSVGSLPCLLSGLFGVCLSLACECMYVTLPASGTIVECRKICPALRDSWYCGFRDFGGILMGCEIQFVGVSLSFRSSQVEI